MNSKARYLVIAGAVGAFSGAVLLVRGLRKELTAPRCSTLIVDRRGTYLGEVAGENEALGYWPLPPNLPNRIVIATLETEDRHFYQHRGIHLPSLLRALRQNLLSWRRVSGASTLAMQVARMQTPGARTLWRKAKEAVEGWWLIRRHGHEAVLRQYLTIASYGNRAHGAARASRLYFDKPIEDLSWLQAAFLAAIPQSPSKMNPYQPMGLRRAMRRARQILGTLRARGIVSEQEYAQALASELGLTPRPRRQPEAMHALIAWSGRSKGTGGPILRATLDGEMQRQTAEMVSRHVAELTAAGATQAAALVVDTENGDILAYVGSRSFFDRPSHGAVDYIQARRSPGSALKPFIYGLGFDKGTLTAASVLADTPLEVTGENGRSYTPENFSHSFLGPMLAREALANSRNIPALRVLSDVGMEPVLQFFERSGVPGVSYAPDAYGLGLAIGNLHVTLEELVALYGILANRGETLTLRRFLDSQPESRRRLLSADAAQLVTHILADPLARRPGFPAGAPLDFEYALAIKTGTSQGFRDAWAVGFSDRLLVGVWIGNPDARRMNRVTGVDAAALLHEVMDAQMPTRAPHRAVAQAFVLPERFVAREVCALSGQLAGPHCPTRRAEWFAPGTEPVETCSFHHEVPIDRRNNLRAGPTCPPDVVDQRVMLDLPAHYERWSRLQHLELAPRRVSPLCPDGLEQPLAISIREPSRGARYLWDPATPAGFSTVRFWADVTPADEEIVWLVDGVPMAKVGYPHEYRWPLSPGNHTVAAAMVRRSRVSEPVTVVVAP